MIGGEGDVRVALVNGRVNEGVVDLTDWENRGG